MLSDKVISIMKHNYCVVEDKLPFTTLMLADNLTRFKNTLENLGLCIQRVH